MAKFKVGDNVTAVQLIYGVGDPHVRKHFEQYIGKQFMILSIAGAGKTPYKLNAPGSDGGAFSYWGEREIELVKKEEEPMKQKFEVGQKITITSIDCAALKPGQSATITKVSHEGWKRGYPYFKNDITGDECSGHSEELKIIQDKKENSMSSKKYYRVIKDLPDIEVGAILGYNQGNHTYSPTEEFWVKDHVENNTAPAAQYNHEVVERSPEFFEAVYEMSHLGKLVYLTREEAKKQAAKFFKA